MLVQSLFKYAESKECQIISGAAASNNIASRALIERFGLTPRSNITHGIKYVIIV
jgi:hypothetical protein